MPKSNSFHGQDDDDLIDARNSTLPMIMFGDGVSSAFPYIYLIQITSAFQLNVNFTFLCRVMIPCMEV